MKFLVDNQLPAALSQYLRGRGVECAHVLDHGMEQASDAEICRFAEQEGATLITKDEDFLYLAARPGSGLRLVWVRIGNCRTRFLLASFERAWPRIVACLSAGERVVELR